MDVTLLADRLRAVARLAEASVVGYPPDDNTVDVTPTDPAVLTAEFGDVPADVLEFFGAFTEVSLPNLWNAYHIGPASWSVTLHRNDEPRAVRLDGVETDVIIVAANGGGTHYGVLVAGGPVLVLPPGGIDKDGVYESEFARPVAGSFGEFVEGLVSAALAGEWDPFDPFRMPSVD
jgi:hypothetical protein